MSTKIGKLLFIGGLGNSALFCILSAVLGGDALNGRIDEDGKHLVSSRGRSTVVSPAVWYLSRAHALSLFLTHPLAILGGMMMARNGRLGGGGSAV
jgi:hypothetical protein